MPQQFSTLTIFLLTVLGCQNFADFHGVIPDIKTKENKELKTILNNF